MNDPIDNDESSGGRSGFFHRFVRRVRPQPGGGDREVDADPGHADEDDGGSDAGGAGGAGGGGDGDGGGDGGD